MDYYSNNGWLVSRGIFLIYPGLGQQHNVNIVHLMPRIVPDRMVIQEISFQTIINEVFLKLAASKRKCWPNFPLNLGFLTLQNSTHATLLGNKFLKWTWGKHQIGHMILILWWPTILCKNIWRLHMSIRNNLVIQFIGEQFISHR